MIDVTLPDGASVTFEAPLSVDEVVAHFLSFLRKKAVAAIVDGTLVDLHHCIHKSATLRILTLDDAECLESVRHSTAHLLAHAITTLFPEAQLAIGPVVASGFYYDFSLHRSLNEDDLLTIEAEMKKLAKANYPIVQKRLSREEAITFFEHLRQFFKVAIIRALPEDEIVTVCQQGHFVDLCRGPHMPRTGCLKFFKLMKIAGAYWQGDSRNEMLQRIYGTAWLSAPDLQQHLSMLEEAEKRDHRILGKKMDLFHIQEESPGMVFWHTKGWMIWQTIEQYMREQLRESGYEEVKTPQFVDKRLWEQSGHWDHYSEHMFITQSEKRDYVVKPMNCPCHVQIFNHRLRSYRDLPMRLSEFGVCHRNEPSGALHGLMRVRSFVQDDAHIFCTPQQMSGEVTAFITLLRKIYHDFGFHDISVVLSLRPEQRIGTEHTWDTAEDALRQALSQQDLPWKECAGEGAFYGPKIEFHIKDAIGRSWQCGTLQLDFALPERLGAEFVDDNNARQTPIMLHRAILGSMERFIGILLENCAGILPLWLAPIQAVVMSLSEKQVEWAKSVTTALQESGLRVSADLRGEKIGYKIRDHMLQGVPYFVVIGARESEARSLSVRRRGTQDLNSLSVDQFTAYLFDQVAKKN